MDGFQADAFQNNAFQINEGTLSSGFGGFYRRRRRWLRRRGR